MTLWWLSACAAVALVSDILLFPSLPALQFRDVITGILFHRRRFELGVARSQACVLDPIGMPALRIAHLQPHLFSNAAGQ